MKAKVKTKWIVNIPEKAKVKVKEGEKVNKGDILLTWESGRRETVAMLVQLQNFSKEQWRGIAEDFMDKRLEKGEKMEGKLVSPMTGVFKGIDDFGNMTFVEQLSLNEVLSPVTSRVSKIEEGKLSLEFMAIEIKGEAIIEGKAWGEGDLVPIDTDVDLSYKHNKNILLVRKLDQTIILKSEVVGAVGLITADNDYDSECDLPILKISSMDWDFLVDKYSGHGDMTMLLNSKKGRLLIVVE